MKKYTNTAILRQDSLTTGNADEGAPVKVYIAGTATEAAIFSDVSGTTPIVQPFNTNTIGDSNPGQFSFYSAGGLFDIVINEGANETRLDSQSISTEVNVKDFGAKGDGVTDDTAAIQAACDSLTGGGTVFVPKSATSYMIDPQPSIKPLSNTTIIIEKGSTLEAITNANDTYEIIHIDSVSNVTIEGGGKIKGDRTTHTGGTGEGGMCIRTDNATNVTIKDLELTEGWGDGVYIGGSGGQSSNITIKDNYIHNNRRNNISVVDGDSGLIDNNIIANANGTNPETGVDLEAGYQENVTNWTVSNNIVKDNNIGGISAVTPWGPLISTVRNITIIGNTVSNNGSLSDHIGIFAGRMLNCSITGNTVSGTTGRGIVVASGGHKIDLVPNSVAAITANINVTDNNVSDSTNHGIFLDANESLADLSNILVSGNTCNDNGGNGIAVDKTSGQRCEDITLDANTCENNTLSGIFINRINDFNITGNTTIANTESGILIGGSASDTFGCVITGNLSKGNTVYGMQLAYANISTVTGNKVLGNGSHGIWSFEGHDSTISCNIITGNSQTTDDTYNGILIERSDNCTVVGNVIRHGGGANQQKYGILIDATALANLVVGNNLVSSGRTGSIQDDSGGATIVNNLV